MTSPRSWEDIDRLAARKGLHAGMLPANQGMPNGETPESMTPGWTCQQPWAHRRYPVESLRCVLCWSDIGPNELDRHDCPVAREIGAVSWQTRG